MLFKPAAILAAIGFAGLAAAAPALDDGDRAALLARHGFAGDARGLARHGSLVRRQLDFLPEFELPEPDSDLEKERAKIEANGWKVFYGKPVTEVDVVTLALSVPTGTVGFWIDRQVKEQVASFKQSFSAYSDDVINEVIKYLVDLVDANTTDETNIKGLDVKAGVATYERELDVDIIPGARGVSAPLMPHYQLYIGLRNPDDATAART